MNSDNISNTIGDFQDLVVHLYKEYAGLGLWDINVYVGVINKQRIINQTRFVKLCYKATSLNYNIFGDVVK